MAQDHTGRTPLHYAASRGNQEAVKVLVDESTDGLRKALIDMCDDTRRTALHLAAQFGLLDVVTYLVDNGADVNKVLKHNNNEKWAALHFAVNGVQRRKHCDGVARFLWPKTKKFI